KVLRALNASLRTYSHKVPWKLLVPDLVATLMMPPRAPPNSARSLWLFTLNSAIESMIGGTAYVLENAPWLLRPSVMNMLLRLVGRLMRGKKKVARDARFRTPPEFCETMRGETRGDISRSCVKLRPLRGRSPPCLGAPPLPSSGVFFCTTSPA